MEPDLDATLQPNAVVRVERSRAVTLLIDGQMHILYTVLTNPAEILAEAGVGLTPADRVIVDGTVAAPDQLGTWPVPASALIVRRAVSIAVEDGDRSERILTTQTTVGEALYAAGYEIFLADVVTPGLDTPVSPDLRVRIERAQPVSILADGQRLQARIQGTSVSDALASANVVLAGLDYTIPDETAPLFSGMIIRVIRVEETLETQTSELPFETVYQADPDLELDQTRVIEAGQPGRQQTTIRVRLENQIEVERGGGRRARAGQSGDRLRHAGHRAHGRHAAGTAPILASAAHVRDELPSRRARRR